MQEQVRSEATRTPILFPIEPTKFWESMRQLIREEVNNQEAKKLVPISIETPGMTYKPLYKIAEVCKLFQVTKPTIYDCVKHGNLNVFKIQSRVYFLWQDIQQLLPVLKQS